MTDKQPDALELADMLDAAGLPRGGALLRTQHAEIERLTKDLAFVERWANHHGAKPHTTAKEALSVIQHYPPIARITRGYADGAVPDTFDPYAAIERKDALLRQALTYLEESRTLEPINLDWVKGARRAVAAAITKELQ